MASALNAEPSEEMKAYANQWKARGKGAIEIALTRQGRRARGRPVRALGFPADRERRPVTFIALFDRGRHPELWRDTAHAAPAPMIAKGAVRRAAAAADA